MGAEGRVRRLGTHLSAKAHQLCHRRPRRLFSWKDHVSQGGANPVSLAMASSLGNDVVPPAPPAPPVSLATEAPLPSPAAADLLSAEHDVSDGSTADVAVDDDPAEPAKGSEMAGAGADGKAVEMEMDELKAEPPEGATPALPAPPDGGYGWILVMACFLTQAFTFGYQTSFGPFQRYFVTNQTFGPGTTNVQIAFVSSLCSAITFIVGPFTAAVIAKIGFRATAITGSLLLALGLELASLANAVWQLYLSYSLIGGIGIALAYIPSTSVVPQWFGKRMGLAMGIAIAGGGIGGLILAPVSQALMDAYDWRMAYRVGGAIAGGVGSLAGLLIKARLPPAKRTGSLLQQYDFHRFKDFTFTRLYLSIMMASLSFFVPYVFVPLYAGSIGIPPTTASVIIGLMNALNAVGRIVMGFVADYFGAMNTWLLNIWLCTMSILLIWTNASTLGLLIFFAVWFGFTGGAFTSLYPLNAAKIWGAQGAAALMGVLFTSLIPGGLLGAVLGGAILDSTTTVAPDGSKQYHFLGLQLYTGFMIMISALILLWVRLERGNTIGKEGVIKGLKLLI